MDSCADLKFTALMLGTQSFTATYCCVFCRKSSKKWKCACDLNTESTCIHYKGSGERRSWQWVQDQIRLHGEDTFRKNKELHYGHARKPVLSALNFDVVMMEELHSMLRIFDKLLAIVFAKV